MTPDAESAAAPPQRFGRWELAGAVALLLLAALLRFWELGSNPPGLFRDEAEKGYTAWQLWETARHAVPGPMGPEITRPLPLFIETFAGHDKTSALYHYLAAPCVGLAGLDVWTTRLPAALAGWAAVLLGWLFGRRLFGLAGGLTVAALLAFHPAGVLFSRWAQQGILLLPLTMGGFWALWEVHRADPRHRRALAVLGGLLLGMAAYAYAPARLVVPALLALFVLTRAKEELRTHRGPFLWAAGIFAACWLPLLLFTLGSGSSRLERVGLGEGGPLGAVAGYFSHFNPRFLFWSGDANMRHALPWNGFVPVTAGLLGLWSMVLLICRAREGEAGSVRDGFFALGWVLAGPLAAALTADAPHALRANLMIPGTALLAGAVWLAGLSCGQKLVLRVALFGMLTLEAARVAYGLQVQERRGATAAWETDVQAILHAAGEAHVPVLLSAGVPYANYHALFAECTPPEAYHEEGLEALNLELVAPDRVPQLERGQVLILPPPSLKYYEEAVVVQFSDGSLMRPAEFLELLAPLQEANRDLPH